LVATELLPVLNPATNSDFSDAQIYGSHPESITSQRKTDYFLSMRSTYLMHALISPYYWNWKQQQRLVKHKKIQKFMSLIHSRESSYNEN
jgi:hypothetical protein